jgi:hypothetical protein
MYKFYTFSGCHGACRFKGRQITSDKSPSGSGTFSAADYITGLGNIYAKAHNDY